MQILKTPYCPEVIDVFVCSFPWRLPVLVLTAVRTVVSGSVQLTVLLVTVQYLHQYQDIHLRLFPLGELIGSGKNGQNSHRLVRVGSAQATVPVPVPYGSQHFWIQIWKMRAAVLCRRRFYSASRTITSADNGARIACIILQ
jgi:hypothetical protein